MRGTESVDLDASRYDIEYKPRTGDGAADVPVDSVVQFLLGRSAARN
jgi:hypothetical protein